MITKTHSDDENTKKYDKERERERERERGERDRERVSERESIIIAKSPKPRNKGQTKVDYTKLSLKIITQNYRQEYYVEQKWVNCRDTGVSKNR